MKSKIIFLAVVAFILCIATDGYSANTYYEIWRNTTNSYSSATRIGEWVQGTTFDDPTNPSPGQNYYY